MKKYIIALDAGTTSIRAMLFDLRLGAFVHCAQQEVGNAYPFPGWVEQDASEIYYKAAYVLNDCARIAGGENVAGVGIANQRETVIAWNGETGEPVCPAIVWQCRRTSEECAAIGGETRDYIRARTGLLPDAYFSASKMRWIMRRVPAARALAKRGLLRFGTVDSYLVWRFTEGKTYATDYTNASRTMLFDIGALRWDEALVRYFEVPEGSLPRAVPCDERLGTVLLQGAHAPIAGVLGDQQAALFGQGCRTEGDGKITYGTGLFMLFPTGERIVRSACGLLSTIGSSFGGHTRYALEGSVFHAGSAVKWLRDEMGLVDSAAETERLARSVDGTDGVVFVPAFTGLGAPYWDSEARGLLAGITRGTTRAHVVRAVLESIAYEARDLSDCMVRDSGVALRAVKCDGGASANDFLMQFQADVLGIAVDRPVERESTALGAALACAVSLGEMGEEECAALRKTEKKFVPSRDRASFDALYERYKKAVARALYRP